MPQDLKRTRVYGMDDRHPTSSNTEGMTKGKSAKGISKGKTKAKKRSRQRAVLSSRSSDLTDTEGSIQTTRKRNKSHLAVEESETDSLTQQNRKQRSPVTGHY